MKQYGFRKNSATFEMTENGYADYTVAVSTVNFKLKMRFNFSPTDKLLETIADEMWIKESGFEEILNARYRGLIEKYAAKGIKITFWYGKDRFNTIIIFYCRVLWEAADLYFCQERFKPFEVDEIAKICEDAIKQNELVC